MVRHRIGHSDPDSSSVGTGARSQYAYTFALSLLASGDGDYKLLFREQGRSHVPQAAGIYSHIHPGDLSFCRHCRRRRRYMD